MTTSNTFHNPIITLVARIFLSILFILAGWGKLTGLEGTSQFFGALGLPLPYVTAILVGIVEFFGGLAILFGFKTRIAAIVVALFTIGATLVAHMDFSQGMNATMAQKNLAIAGGLLLLAQLGAGAFSIDGRKRK